MPGMSPLFLLLIATAMAVTESFILKPNRLCRVQKLNCAESGLIDSRAEIIRLCGHITVGKAVDESLALSIKEQFEIVEKFSTRQGIIDNISLMEGDWLLLYSTMPRFFHRVALKDVSANTLTSAEPLIIMDSVTQVVKEKSPGVYFYNNRIEFQGGRENTPSIPGKHTTRGYATHNLADSGEGVLRLDVEFYENEAQSMSCLKADTDEFSRLFGYPEDETIIAQFPPNFKAWSDVVYLDEDLRLMRGGRGSMYVLRKV